MSFLAIINYINKRKINITLLLILVVPCKLLLHFFIFREWQQDFQYHIDVIFKSANNLYPVSVLILLYLSWLLNDKIKAR